MTVKPLSPDTSYDSAAVAAAIDSISAGLERALADLANLKSLLATANIAGLEGIDPKDPANKVGVKLTDQGIEVCYRLFDAGKTRYAVGELMDISFQAADHRWKAWQQLGGANRVKQALR